MKLYVREPGTDEVLRLASRTANHRLAILALSKVEFRSAIRKRQRARDLDEDAASGVLARFERHVETRYVCQILSESVLDTAACLIDRHILRAYDSIQLAGCLALRDTSGDSQPTFVCADRDLLRAAEIEGLNVLDPAR